MRRGDGFSLIEVVVAGGLLAIGILAVFTLQAQALQVQRRVSVVRELVAVAEAELYERLAQAVPAGGACRTMIGAAGPISGCVVEVEACSTSADPLCAAYPAAGATRVEVIVEAGEQEFRLAALHGRFGPP